MSEITLRFYSVVIHSGVQSSEKFIWSTLGRA